MLTHESPRSLIGVSLTHQHSIVVTKTIPIRWGNSDTEDDLHLVTLRNDAFRGCVSSGGKMRRHGDRCPRDEVSSRVLGTKNSLEYSSSVRDLNPNEPKNPQQMLDTLISVFGRREMHEHTTCVELKTSSTSRNL